MQDAVLPGTAVRLLIDTAHTVSVAKDKKRPRLVLEEDVIAKVEEVTKVKISAPQGQEKEVLLHLVIAMTSSGPSGLKVTTSSKRFKSSGLNR